MVVDDASFEVRAGEIVGIAGVAGNGQSELIEAIAGIRTPDQGKITLHGKEISGVDPATLRDLGLAHLPEDRQKGGTCAAVRWQRERHPRLPGRPGFFPRGSSSIARRSARWRRSCLPATTCGRGNPALRAALFSGGNQQKIVCAREIERDPSVLLIGQPTRGVDIGAIEFIHKRPDRFT